MSLNLSALRSASFSMLASASSGSREYFPVNANQYLYSHFEYVAGTPVDDGSGIQITKLKILNTIIDQLITMRNSSGAASSEESLELLGDGALEEEIAQKIISYQMEVQAMVESAQTPLYGLILPEAGLLFSIEA